jgi:hypothetical protein
MIMSKYYIVFLLILIFYFSGTSQTNYWLTGEIHTEAIKKDISCNCNDIRKIYYLNNEKQTSSVICLDNVSYVVDGHLVVYGYFDDCSQFNVTKTAGSTDLIKGVFKTTNYKCPLTNEGVIIKEDDSKVEVTSTFNLFENDFVEVTNAAWSLKTCEGKLFSVYHIYSSTKSNLEFNRKREILSGDFESYKGVMKPISQYGYNIGLLTQKGSTGAKEFFVCFDRLRNGDELSISGFITVEGYFETVTHNPDPNSSHQVIMNPVSGKSEPIRESQNIFFVTKIH